MTEDFDRQLLPRTLGPWFSRFAGLTPIQREAIPLILEGRDVLLCSATASGKTEAYAAPAAEIALAEGAPSGGVIIVSPTRALANDLKRRLEGPMERIDLGFGRYTGEHKELHKGELPAVIVTTPEALDSMLARRAAMLSRTRVVIIDEVHVLDGTPRGDQLRVLLHRMNEELQRRPQMVAASATVDNPQELAVRYLADPLVVTVPGARRIRGREFAGRGVLEMAQHLNFLAQNGLRKILVFCRSRNEVERFTSKLGSHTRFQEHVYAHHGSLAKVHRERTERLFHQAPAAVCFATLTLEMGIDIGTVDYVLLANLPSDIPSLLQRIGRGGRRGDTTRAGYVVENAGERHIVETMFRLGKEGRLCGAPYVFRPSVLAQQALVLACARGWIEHADLWRCVPPPLREWMDAEAVTALLERMVERDLLERMGSRYVPTEAVEARYARGSLHSNIDDGAGQEVVDRLTGDVIGHIDGAEKARIELGGANRRIVKTEEGRILTDASAAASPARFRARGTPSTPFRLARAIVEAAGVEEKSLLQFPEAGSWWLVHGLGSVGALLLTELLGRAEGSESTRAASPHVHRLAKPLDRIPQLSEEAILRFVHARIGGLERLVAPGPWKEAVPAALRERMAREGTGIDEVSAFLRSAKLLTRDRVGDELRELAPLL